MSKRILFIGPVTNVEEGLVGGATVSFGYLVDYFQRQECNIRVINTQQHFGTGSGLLNIFSVFAKLVTNIFWANVYFLNSSRKGTKYLAPLLFYISRLMRAKFIFRPFGGDLLEYTAEYGTLASWFFKNKTLKADVLFLQTDQLLQAIPNSKPLRTSRKKPSAELLKKKEYGKRFVFLGFVLEDKGIDEIIAARTELPEDFTIHIYGPIKSEKYSNLSGNLYKGVLQSDEVLKVISEYDVLLLPTYYEGEGYPGAIIEAYSLGIPVISTYWRSIPEIVKDKETGYLIPTQSAESLIEVMKRISKENYPSLSENALRYFNDTFDEEKVLGMVRQEIESL